MKILMVCLGNICRSPLAHGILKHKVQEAGLDWTVESAGTGDWHVGHAPDRRAIAVAKNNGVDISSQKARQFKPGFFDLYDKIYVMDKKNLEDVLALAKTSEQKQKVELFLKDSIVPDPYFDDAMFAPVFDMVNARCQQIIDQYKA